LLEIPGWFDFQALYEEAVRSAPSPSHFVEVGAWLGRSTAFLARAIIRSGKDIRLDVVDTWEGTPGEAVYEPMLRRYSGQARNVLPVFLDFMEQAGVRGVINPMMMNSVEASRKFTDRSLDFVFLDADHSYNAVRADLTHWFPKVKLGGLFAGHDYTNTFAPGVARAVDDFFQGAAEVWGTCWVVRKAPPA
jgi:predicted O-methyltransferase YrrM